MKRSIAAVNQIPLRVRALHRTSAGGVVRLFARLTSDVELYQDLARRPQKYAHSPINRKRSSVGASGK